ncbi:MAG: holo-ACP synthase [Nitrospinota bacterium]|nr:holo-ACP synthase [Nitrospinota bacterium]
MEPFSNFISGVDLCNPMRIQRAIVRHGERFLRRVFTEQEIEYCSAKRNPYPSYAARFAAKEAAMKLLGAGLTKVGFSEVEVVTLDSGKPTIIFHGRAKALAMKLGVLKVDLSLSHERDMAIAMAVAVVQGA